MPTFQTPEPIAVTVDVLSGTVTVIASDRADTVVEVRPADASKRMTHGPPSRSRSISPPAT